MQILLNNPLFQAYSASDPFGKAIFLTLFALSLLTWTVFFKKFLSQRNFFKEKHFFEKKFNASIHHPLGLELANDHPLSALYSTLKHHTLELLNKNHHATSHHHLSRSDIDLIEAHLLTHLSEMSKRFSKRLYLLSTIVSLAPFLGLLGTVWGILLTFNELQGGATLSSSSSIMGGLAMALGTTVLGLLVAIPALISHTVLKARSEELTGELESLSYKLLASIELNYRKVDL